MLPWESAFAGGIGESELWFSDGCTWFIFAFEVEKNYGWINVVIFSMEVCSLKLIEKIRTKSIHIF